MRRFFALAAAVGLMSSVGCSCWKQNHCCGYGYDCNSCNGGLVVPTTPAGTPAPEDIKAEAKPQVGMLGDFE